MNAKSHEISIFILPGVSGKKKDIPDWYFYSYIVKQQCHQCAFLVFDQIHSDFDIA